ncbi:MAG: SH3 domain-containing protein [Bdellovibrionota bacterium]
MEWNCPHCSTGISVSDSNLGNTWSFARCYQCKNFSLIHKAEPENIIRVDSPPGSESTQSFVIDDSGKLVEKPVVRPATKTPHPETEANEVGAPKVPLSVEGFPAALPEIPEAALSPKYVRGVSAIAGAVIFLIGGVIYFSNDSGLEPSTELSDQRIKSAGRFQPLEIPKNPLEHEAKVQNPAPQGFQFNEESVNTVRASPEAAPVEALAIPNVYVRSKVEGTLFYGGPGIKYPVLGTLNPNLRYSIAEAKDEWFKVQNDESNIVYGWIRNTAVDYVAVEKKAKTNSQIQ